MVWQKTKKIVMRITKERLVKDGWKQRKGSVKSTPYWYFTGNFTYRLDQYPDTDMFIFDVPNPNLGGWYGLRDVDDMETLRGLIKFLEKKI